jgi:hypothetical protein
MDRLERSLTLISMQIVSKTSPAATAHPEVIRSHMPPLGMARWDYLEEVRAVRKAMRRRLDAVRNRHEGKRAFIIGNAPSVAGMDLGLLKNEVSFAVNSTFRLYPRMGSASPYTVFSDRVRWHETGSEMLEKSVGSEVFYCDDWEYPTPPGIITQEQLTRVTVLDQLYALPFWLNAITPFRNRAGLFTYGAFRRPRFSWDPRQGICVAKSVIFPAAQLAAWMGCNPIILIGVEMNYSQPQAHFHGKTVWTPEQDYDREVKPWFLLFRNALDSRGIRFINATPGGRVNELERVDYSDLFKMVTG